MEAGKRRLASDTARAATTDEVKELRREASALKEVVAEQTFEIRVFKKAWQWMGMTRHGVLCIKQFPSQMEAV